MEAFLEFLKSQGVTIITSALSGGVLSGIIVARYNWKIEINRDIRKSRRKLIESIDNIIDKYPNEAYCLAMLQDSKYFIYLKKYFPSRLIKDIELCAEILREKGNDEANEINAKHIKVAIYEVIMTLENKWKLI